MTEHVHCLCPPCPLALRARRHARAAHAPCTQLPGSVRRRSIGDRDRSTAPEITPSTAMEALRAPDDSTCAGHLPSRLVRSATPLAARTRQVRLRSCSAHGRRVLHEQGGVVLQCWHAKGRDWWWGEGSPLLWGVDSRAGRPHTCCQVS